MPSSEWTPCWCARRCERSRADRDVRRRAATQGSSAILPPGCPPARNSRRLTSLGQRERARDRHLEMTRCREFDEVRPHAIAVGGARRHGSADRPDPVGRRALRRRDRDDPLAVGHELERGVDGLVGADGVERGRDRPGRGIPNPLGEPRTVSDRDAAEPANALEARRARAADHVHAQEPRLLENAHAYGARRAMHDDDVAAGSACHVQHLGCRRAREQQIRGGLERDADGLREDTVSADGELGRVAARHAEGDDLVSHFNGTRSDPRVGADRRHDSGDLIADRDRKRDARTLSCEVLEVRRVDAGGPYRDRHLARTRRRDVVLDELPQVGSAPLGRDPPLRHVRTPVGPAAWGRAATLWRRARAATGRRASRSAARCRPEPERRPTPAASPCAR